MTLPGLEALLPHRAPMLLLDEVVRFDSESVTCRVTIRSDSMFAVDGQVPAWAALEYCAQSVAAFVGLRSHASGEAPRLGMLIAARELSLSVDSFAPGDVLSIESKLQFGEARVGRFECAVTREGSVVAKATLSVYQPEDRHAGSEAS